MDKKRTLLAAAIAAGFFLTAVVSEPLFIFLSVAMLLGGLWFGSRFAFQKWKRRPFLQKARYVSDICRVDYFRRVPEQQLETWLLSSLTARGYVLLGDPVLGRSLIQGYAWLSGKKAVVVIQQARVLTVRDLDRIYTLKNRFKVETVLVFSPFPEAPFSTRPGLEVLAGDEFLSWTKELSGVPPLHFASLPSQNCSCGSPQFECVSRAGEPLLLCSRYPDCRQAQQPTFENVRAAAA